MADHPTDQPSREGGRAELWRCPECGAAAWHHTREYPLPGGPALCTHPTPTYERFVPASTLQAAEVERDEAQQLLGDYAQSKEDAEADAEAAEAREDALRKGIEAHADSLERAMQFSGLGSSREWLAEAVSRLRSLLPTQEGTDG